MPSSSNLKLLYAKIPGMLAYLYFVISASATFTRYFTADVILSIACGGTTKKLQELGCKQVFQYTPRDIMFSLNMHKALTDLNKDYAKLKISNDMELLQSKQKTCPIN